MIYDIIRQCKEHYGIDYKFSDITDCDGCKSGKDRLFKGSVNCKIRKCAIDKGVKNCAYCEKYACDSLMELFNSDPGAKERLDVIRSHL